MADEEEWHHLPWWAHEILRQLAEIKKEIRQMTDDQKHLDADVQALTDGISAVEAEVASLKAQPAAAAIDFTALDAAVARVTADAPAPAAAPTPAPADVTPAPQDPAAA